MVITGNTVAAATRANAPATQRPDRTGFFCDFAAGPRRLRVPCGPNEGRVVRVAEEVGMVIFTHLVRTRFANDENRVEGSGGK